MKRIIFTHRWNSRVDEMPYVWLRDQLKARGYGVVMENMPNTAEPKVEEWASALIANVGKPDENKILVGHSIGGNAVLRYLAGLGGGQKVGGVVLLAPYVHLDESIKAEGDDVVALAKPWVDGSIDWKEIKTHCDKFTVILSDNDPYVSVSEGDFFKDKLGANIRVESGRYHFSPETGTIDLPEVLEEIEKMS